MCVGAIGSHVRSFETLKHIATREPKRFAVSQRDDCVLRADCVEQLLSGAGRAAMVTDLQHVGMRVELQCDAALNWLLGVAFEQH